MLNSSEAKRNGGLNSSLDATRAFHSTSIRLRRSHVRSRSVCHRSRDGLNLSKGDNVGAHQPPPLIGLAVDCPIGLTPTFAAIWRAAHASVAHVATKSWAQVMPRRRPSCAGPAHPITRLNNGSAARPDRADSCVAACAGIGIEGGSRSMERSKPKRITYLDILIDRIEQIWNMGVLEGSLLWRSTHNFSLPLPPCLPVSLDWYGR